MLSDEQIKKLEATANTIRQDIIAMLLEAKSGHSAGPLGMADVFTVLYHTDAVKNDPKNPDWEERDRIILSNGHICPVLYAAMARAGYFLVEELKTLRKFGARLQGHPHRLVLPGLETSSGPIGSGLSQAAGMAYALRMDGKKNHVICLMGDGEQDCGQIWEAVMWAGKNKLDNLTAIIDRNNIQIDGFTEDIMPLEPLREKYESFGWHVIDIDGNNIMEIYNAINKAKAVYEKPVCILAHTVPGKGVDFMEFKYEWHGKPPNGEEAKEALRQLRTLGGKISGE
ncbi:TPA: transketolase [Patescibacteria group bacterium]|nr:MAG: Transketolase domain protein [Parcubacteria group bacterium GW2011_GWF2_40_10]KKR47067.1 MAG: Transketolase domain protein [Parcubacteria group bacterium GW2011_GWA2_40_143]KKR59746.1 MAG: Transketolase domain protein [Parcubacteria group bacterium GW2011_GWC2_40_31]KKR74994.1 MAG: Transketolase domain protein [Parcubacteria group bacterium GW2011_GWB2_40_8]HCI04415.1 transketolase [Patescibacteria group bacterium]